MAQYYNPVEIHFGVGEIKKLSHILNKFKIGNNVLMLTGRNSLKRSGHIDIIMNQLKHEEIMVYDGITSNPNIEDLYKAKKNTDGLEYGFIIAVGGGSVLDTAKCLVALKDMNIKSPEDVRSIIDGRYYSLNKDKCGIIAVPTTAGTGSEVTSWATVWDRQIGKKYSLEDTKLYPLAAVIDPGLTLSLPVRLTASTALDALCHAVEAYWSKNSNEVVRMYALKAIESIVKNIEPLFTEPQNIDKREKISFGSLYAGLAFSNTKTTACHSISYPLTLMYGIDHGIAASLTLAKMAQINESCIVEKKRFLSAFGLDSISDIDGLLNRIYDKTGISYRLRDYGVGKKDFESIISKSFTPGRMDNNPTDISREILKDLLNSIY